VWKRKELETSVSWLSVTLRWTIHHFWCNYMYLYLQCTDTVGWASGRAPGQWKLSDGVLVWLSVWSEMQIVCILSSWCPAIPKRHHFLPHLNPDWFYLSRAGLSTLSWKRGHYTSVRYDTIRDVILTCTRKPTWVSLIYCMEPTTKKCKTEKLKSKKGYAQK